MIGHQAIGVTDPTVPSDNTRQSAQKQLAVSVGKKYLMASVAAAGQMINGAGKF